jgi:hypothetical protein
MEGTGEALDSCRWPVSLASGGRVETSTADSVCLNGWSIREHFCVRTDATRLVAILRSRRGGQFSFSPMRGLDWSHASGLLKSLPHRS